MAEAEANYTRHLTAAKLQGKSVEEVEKNQNRSMLKEVNRRVKVSLRRKKCKNFVTAWEYKWC